MWPAIIAGAAALGGGLLGNRNSESNLNKNADLQREFAKQGVRWKVEDAKAAGIHPLYALGAQTHSFSPIAMQDSLGPAIANMGQDVSRAMHATRTASEREAANAQAVVLGKLSVERAGLENELLRSQIARTQSQVGPPMAQAFPISSDGIVTRDLTEVRPSEVISARSEDSSVQAGPANPAFQEQDFGGVLGKWKILGNAASQGLEDMDIAKYVATVAANSDKFGFLKNYPPNLVYQWFNRPSWVDRMARREGARTMLPYYKDGGKLYWRPVF